MDRYRHICGLICALIADTTWLFVLFNIVAVSLGQPVAPLSWVIVLLLLTAAMAAAVLATGSFRDFSRAAMVQGVAGLLAVYLAVSFAHVTADMQFGLNWGAELMTGGPARDDLLVLLLVIMAAGFTWRHGNIQIAEARQEVAAKRGFRAGVIVFAVGLLLQLVWPEKLAIDQWLLPFFVASLAGLAIHHLPDDTGFGGFWLRVITAAIALSTLLGLGLGYLGNAIAGGSARAVGSGLGYMFDGLFWLLRAILEPFLKVFFAFIAWLRSQYGPSERNDPERVGFSGWRRPEGEINSDTLNNVMDFLEYPLLLLLIWVAYRFLVLAFAGAAAQKAEVLADEREMMAGDETAAAYLLRRLKAVLPDWLTGASTGLKAWRYPRDKPGITEVFELYFELLSLAVRRGHLFVAAHTPSERMRRLQKDFPAAPVAQITECFNAACFGRQPTDRATMKKLRQSLSAALKQKD